MYDFSDPTLESTKHDANLDNWLNEKVGKSRTIRDLSYRQVKKKSQPYSNSKNAWNLMHVSTLTEYPTIEVRMSNLGVFSYADSALGVVAKEQFQK